jgi:hypothetical protein
MGNSSVLPSRQGDQGWQSLAYVSCLRQGTVRNMGPSTYVAPSRTSLEVSTGGPALRQEGDQHQPSALTHPPGAPMAPLPTLLKTVNLERQRQIFPPREPGNPSSQGMP